jgi:hypothetical protein
MLTGKVFQGTVHFVPELKDTETLRANLIEFYYASMTDVINPPFEVENLTFSEEEANEPGYLTQAFWKKDMTFMDLFRLQYQHILAVELRVKKELTINGESQWFLH